MLRRASSGPPGCAPPLCKGISGLSRIVVAGTPRRIRISWGQRSAVPSLTESRYPPISELASRYRVLPYAIDLRIPGFAAMDRYNLRTYAPEAVDSGAWFGRFVDVVVEAVGRRFLPIIRLADGEFLFLLGFQPPTPRVGMSYPLQWLRWFVAKWKPRRQLRAGGSHGKRPLYTSAKYSVDEVTAIRASYKKVLAQVASDGLIAADLSFCAVPFQDHFFPALRRWLNTSGIQLSIQNYVPFYFVYALLTGPHRHRVLRGRRILVVHSASGTKRESIQASLLREGATEVLWHTISPDRSLYDVVPVERFVGAVDLCVFGAGIGKPAILAQLEPLGVPCIDAGYVMEVWADPSVARSRIFTQPDESDVAVSGAGCP